MNPLLPADTDNHRFQQQRWLSEIGAGARPASLSELLAEIVFFGADYQIVT
jgi:hypothetical protein